MKQNGEGVPAVVVVMPCGDVAANILCRTEEADFLVDRRYTSPTSGRLPYKGSGTLKKTWKKLTGKLPSPTVTRKQVDANTETDSTATQPVDKPVMIRVHSTEQLEAEGKTVRAHLQYMQVFFKDLDDDSKNFSQVPEMTETILMSMKNFLDVTNTLLKGVRSQELQNAKDMALNRRIDLLKGLAQLVRWADSLYLSESRRSIDNDASSTHFDPLAEAVKNLVTTVSSLCSRQQQSGSPDETVSRMRHRSLPSVRLDMFNPPDVSGVPVDPRIAASCSTENLLEPKSPKSQRNTIVSSDSDGQISRIIDSGSQLSAAELVETKFNTSPRMRRKEISPLAKRRLLTSTGSSIDRLSDISGDSCNELNDASSGSSPNPQQIDNEEDEKPPPLPMKKRHSLPGDAEVSPDNRPGFLPLYMDERAKAKLGLTQQDPVVEPETRAPLPAKYNSIGLDLNHPAFRKVSEPVRKRGPMKATVDILAGMNGVQAGLHAGLPENHTAVRRQHLTGHPPTLLNPMVVTDGSDQPPPKPPRHRNSTSSRPIPLPLDLTLKDSVSDTSTLDDSPSTASFGSDTTLTEPHAPHWRMSLPETPVSPTGKYPLSPSLDISDVTCPPPKPPRPSTGSLVRPPKPPRPPTPVKLPDVWIGDEDPKPPPLPLKKKHVAKYSEMFTQQYTGPADGEYDPPLYYQPLQLSSWSHPDVVDWNTLPLSPATRLEFGHETSEQAPPLPAKKRSLSSRGRMLSLPYESSSPADVVDSVKSSSNPNVLDIINSDEHHSDSEDTSADAEVAAQPLFVPPDKLDKYLLFTDDDKSSARVLRGGTVDALIACACAAKETGPEGPYFEAFLMTYQTFVASDVVLEKLLESYDFYLTKGDQLSSRNTLSLLMRVVDYLGNELNQEITNRLIDVVYRLLSADELQLALVLRLKLIQKWKYLHEQKVPPGEFLRTMPDPMARARKMTEFKSRQLAEQMSLLDMKFFQNIEVREMLLWAEEQIEEKNPSLTAFTAHFNNVSGWCRTRLIESKDPKEREKVALKLLKVMKHLRLMNNFNSYLAILSAMDSAAISRLDWSDDVIKGLDEPHALIDNASSFKAYRTALREAKPPCIPYIGMFLQDLTFLHLGSPSFLDKEKKFVNFTKRWKQFNVVKKIRQCQQVEYQVVRDEAVIQVFNKFENYLGDEVIYQRSLQFKPRQF